MLNYCISIKNYWLGMINSTASLATEMTIDHNCIGLETVPKAVVTTDFLFGEGSVNDHFNRAFDHIRVLLEDSSFIA
jgi:hypothetical protein